MSDEDWIGFNTLDVEQFREQVKQDFRLELETGGVDVQARAAIAAD